jgi:hypothetical protein
MGDELLSQFKVVSFDNLEEDDPPPSVQVDDTGQLLLTCKLRKTYIV